MRKKIVIMYRRDELKYLFNQGETTFKNYSYKKKNQWLSSALGKKNNKIPVPREIEAE